MKNKRYDVTMIDGALVYIWKMTPIKHLKTHGDDMSKWRITYIGKG